MAVPSDKMPFGKYKGTPINKLPASYLKWMVKEMMGGEFDEYAKAALQVLKSPRVQADQTSEDLDDEATRFLKKHGIDMPAESGTVYKNKGIPAKFQKWRRRK